MLRAQRTILNPSLTLKPLMRLRGNTQSYRKTYCNQSPFLSHHHLFDEISNRTAFISQSLSLLKQSPTDLTPITCIHSLTLKINAIGDISIRTSLLTAYARAHDMNSSLSLFDETVVGRDLISWNAIITACVLNSRLQMSVDLFKEMVAEFGEFDSTTLVILLSALSRANNLEYGSVLHGTVIKRQFETDLYIGNALIDMYAKCGDLNSSEFVFQEMETKDTTSWNSIITGSLHNNSPMRSALYFKEMCSSNMPDEISLSSMISACSCLQHLSDFGESVHGWVVKLGYKGTAHSSVCNSLISFYSSIGCIEAAEKLFESGASRNVVSWNSMINCLIENGRVGESLSLIHEMQSTSTVQLDSVTLLIIISVCIEHNLLPKGKTVHGFSIKNNIGSSNLSVVNSLLDMYLKSGDLISADILFRTIPNKDLISWNTIISEFSRLDLCRMEARVLFCELLQEVHECSLATLLAILPSCHCPQDLNFGRSIHCWELKYGFGNMISATNALMLMYVNCEDLTASLMLLQTNLAISNIVSWNTILAGFVKNEHFDDALEAFVFIRRHLILHPDHITVGQALSACGNLNLLSHGKSLHGLSLKSPIGKDIQVRNSLMTMYFRCRDTKSSELVFHTEGDINLCSWTCMISGFAQNRNGRRALEYFRHMKISNFQPNDISIVGVLCACTHIRSLTLGREAHGYIFRYGFQDNVFISSAIVDMYSKCGRLDMAIRAFESSQEKSIASWNSMISAYGFHGLGRKAIELLSGMTDSGVRPTKSTFIALLSACSHNGLADEGFRHYNLMLEEFGLHGTIEHHLLMVDMLGRAGRLHEAYEFVKDLGMRVGSEVWGSLLRACKDHGDLEMGKLISDHLICLDPDNTGYYVTLSNLYAYNGMWNHAEDVRSTIQDRGLSKPPGSSSIVVPGGNH